MKDSIAFLNGNLVESILEENKSLRTEKMNQPVEDPIKNISNEDNNPDLIQVASVDIHNQSITSIDLDVPDTPSKSLNEYVQTSQPPLLMQQPLMPPQ